MLQPGTKLGPYKIISELGAGGMGVVYRARDLRLERDVAIKVLSDRLSGDSAAFTRFELEAKAVAALSHPNILAIHDFDREGLTYYAVTEFLEGETLRQRMGGTPLPWRKAAEIGALVAEGLSAAHSKGVVHRDLKPENIFLTVDGQVKILDFGLAQMKPSGLKEPVSEEYAETEDRVVGTFGYMSPEQIRSEPVDGRSDIFSLGCILFEMVSGKKPFPGKNVGQILLAVINDEPAEFENSAKPVVLELRKLILHCLEKNPSERFQSAHDIAFNLKIILNTATTAGSASFAFQPHRSLLPWSIPLALLLIAVGVSFYLIMRRDKSVQSIAVLPFESLDSGSDTAYLSEGISESIINHLAGLPQLRVLARSTVNRYKGKRDPQQIGKELQVDAILTGNIIERDDMLIIRTELVNASNGYSLWGEQFTRRASNVLTVQDEISRKIAENLHVRLSGDEQRRFAKQYTDSNEAYQNYLKGRYYWNRRTADGLQKGARYFQQAIDLDPSYALAYAGLADCYALMGDYDLTPPEEAFSKAKAAALRALEIDEELAEAHNSMGHIFVYYWDFKNAEKEFKRAISLKPGYATAHQWYSNLLILTGRSDEALEEIKNALQLDPLSLSINVIMGRHLYLARRYDASISQYKKTIEMEPNFAPAHSALGWSYSAKGMHDLAIQTFRKAIMLEPESTDYVGQLGYGYAAAGNRSEALQVISELQKRMEQKYVSPVYVAMIYSGLNMHDQAFEWLTKAYQEHAEFLTFLKVEPVFDPIRDDPRYAELIKKIGL